MVRALAIAAILSLGGEAVAASSEVLFPRPASLEARVQFWTRVYSEVDTEAGLIHDSEHLDVVYEVISLPERLSSRARERRIRQTKDRYEAILRRLARNRRGKLGSDERRVLSLWPEGVSSSTLRHAARRVRFQLGQADKFRDGLVRSGNWTPHIRRVFAAEGIPQELAVLPHVESSFNPRAVSKAGAAGMWQFTRATGRRFMRIDSAIDERFDPFRSSEAAAALLRENHEKTGTWPLAITAYNHGTSGVRRAIRKTGTREIGTIVQRYRSRSFGFASRNFYSEFLAALDVDREAETHFGPLARAEPVEHEAVVLDRYYPVRALSRAFGVDVELLRDFNPALRSSVWRGEKYAPRGFVLHLPRVADRAPATTLLASIPPEQRFAKQRPDRSYRVRRGDTLSTIARRFGVRQRDLVARNGLRNRHRIRVGQVLHIPQRGGAAGARSAKAAPARTATPSTYRVRKGQTLSHIARQLGVPAHELAAANGIQRPDRIHAGQLLRVPGPGRAARSPVAEPAPEPGPAARAPAAAAGRPAPAPAAESPAERADEPGRAQPRVAAPAEGAAEDGKGGLRFDPSRYAVDADGRIVVQPEETLGHLAEWLESSARRLRALNRMTGRTPLVIGRRLRLDFSRISRATFEERRVAHHRAIRETFFRTHRIAGTEEHVLRRGETLWELSRQRYRLPVWLLSDCNPDVQLGDLRPGERLRIPRIEPRST